MLMLTLTFSDHFIERIKSNKIYEIFRVNPQTQKQMTKVAKRWQ